MNFVNADRGLEPVFAGTLREPVRVVPAIRFEIGDDGARVGAEFGAEGVGIGLERKHVSVRADDFEFVDGAFGQFGDEDFPDSGSAACTHGMDAAVPAIEVTDDTDPFGAGSPDGEMNAANAFKGDEMRAKFLIGVVVAALAHEIEVKLSEDAGESKRIVNFKGLAVVGTAADPVACGRMYISVGWWQNGLEKAFVTQFRGFDNRGRRNRDVV